MMRDIEPVMKTPFRQLDSVEEVFLFSNFQCLDISYYVSSFLANSNLQSMEISASSDSSSEDIPRCKKLKIFDCGECFVGEQIASSLLVKNIGGEGRFFIMSEIDWCSMNIEVRILTFIQFVDVTNVTNVLYFHRLPGYN